MDSVIHAVVRTQMMGLVPQLPPRFQPLHPTPIVGIEPHVFKAVLAVVMTFADIL